MKPLSEQTLYEILEIPDDAPLGEIQRAYDRARSLYGPGSVATYTLVAPEEQALLGQRIEEARSVLLDPVARAGYDARLASGTPVPQAGRTSESRPTVTATAPPGFGQPAERAAVPVAAREQALPPPPPPPVAGVLPPTPRPPPPPELPAAAPVPVVVSAAAPVPATPPFAAVAPVPPSPAPADAAAPARVPEKTVFPEGTRWTGEMLRRAREGRGLTVQALAERTKITRHHIDNVEQDRFNELPAPVYLRGIVMSLARELRLDGQKVARSYLEQVAAALHQSK